MTEIGLKADHLVKVLIRVSRRLDLRGMHLVAYEIDDGRYMVNAFSTKHRAVDFRETLEFDQRFPTVQPFPVPRCRGEGIRHPFK